MFSGGLSCAGEQICCSSADSPLLTCWSFTKSSCFCSFVTMHVLCFSVCSFIRSKISLILIWFISFFVPFHHFVSFIWCFANVLLILSIFFSFFLTFFFLCIHTLFYFSVCYFSILACFHFSFICSLICYFFFHAFIIFCFLVSFIV